MRTKEKWENMKWRYLDKFPPRIQRDLKEIKTLPKVNDKLKNESVFIYGDVRTGKTLLAAQLLMCELERIYLEKIELAHNRTLFISFSDLLENTKSGYGSPNEKVFDKYMNAHYLVIDDFIAARPTDWVLETVYRLINHRYENLLPTVITCNFNLPQLEKIIGDQRITSRINGSYLILEKNERFI